MISLDQITLLEQKIESAVAKIQQLQSENDALRKKCAELTNALSEQSEQLSSFETDQNQIEAGIKKALDRLNFIENSVLKTAIVSTEKTVDQVQKSSQPVVTQILTTPPLTTPVNTIKDSPEIESETQDFQPSFDTMTSIETETSTDLEQESLIEQESSFEHETLIDDSGIEQTFDETDESLDLQDSPEFEESSLFQNSTQIEESFESFDTEDYSQKEDSQDGLGFDIF